MGIENHAARFLIACRALGTDLSDTVMLGHQYFWGQKEFLSSVCAEVGLAPPPASVYAEQYADEFLRWAGALHVSSIDASHYEHASIVMDLNQPLPEELVAKFSAVLDIGTLEHVFNFPAAIGNCMRMLKVGGDFIAVCPTNNFMGHGFYQFSPELFFRVFSSENGFEMVRMVFAEVNSDQWYEVKDPTTVGCRVGVRNSRMAYLMVCARKVADLPVLARPPQQSDYLAVWNDRASAGNNLPGSNSEGSNWKAWVKKLLPSVLRNAYEGYTERFTRPHFGPNSAFPLTTTLGGRGGPGRKPAVPEP